MCLWMILWMAESEDHRTGRGVVVRIEYGELPENCREGRQKAGTLDLVPVSDKYWPAVARHYEYVDFVFLELGHLGRLGLAFLEFGWDEIG